ncbi:MAG TPA: peptidoglycan editing factor PgeF [Bryobacteraceae bacterium]|nr:peptidoglycan editing factor PgeF [Bryobacteraceae bacterium]
MFYKDPANIYRVQPLDEFDWLVHGFGTRDARLPENLATLKQIHSTTCIAAEGRSGLLGEGDALLENAPGRVVAVKTADCIPVLLADVRNRAVAAVHAGWRGTVGRIAAGAVRAMAERYGTRPEDLRAMIGPGIGSCCYEVGPEVAGQFGYAPNGRVHLDLPEANRRQLVEAGLEPEHIWVAGLCTMCRAEEFYSFRREREHAGRMHSFIGLR